jgi:alanyl-tRNA synthetase
MVVAQGKKMGKSVYVFSADDEGSKVVHVNFVDPSLKAKGLDARAWANNAAAIVGGKVGFITWCRPRKK